MSEGSMPNATPTLDQGPGVFRRTYDTFLTLVLPVSGLLAVYTAAYYGSTRFVTNFDVFPAEQWYLNPGYWLTYGHLALPFLFLVLNLVNRRRGPGAAIASLMFTWGILLAVLGWAVYTYGLGAVEGRVASLSVAATFFGALFAGQLICVYLFDQLRGIPWWRAPFYGALVGGVTFAGFFYGQTAYWTDEPWASRLVLVIGIYVGAAFINLFIYNLLRRWVRPLSGFGGA